METVFLLQDVADTEADGRQPEVPEPKSSLIVLTDDSFTHFVTKGSFFIKFYAPWCGHCQKLAPVWDDLADTFNHDNKVNIAKVGKSVGDSSKGNKSNGLLNISSAFRLYSCTYFCTLYLEKVRKTRRNMKINRKRGDRSD